MKNETLLAILRLQKCRFIGDTIAKRLIGMVGDVTEIFNEKSNRLQRIEGVGSALISYLKDEENLRLAEKELEVILKNKVSFSYFLDDDYPQYLKHCPDGPILFFKRGNISLENRKIISVVGTRNMTLYGRDFCQELIHYLKIYNPVIVSGYAYGVDICAHKEALKQGLQTIGVLANGLQLTYPKTHKKYTADIEANGGFISEFWQYDEPLRENFLRRNRIIAGMSQATIVIESGEKGGSLVTADIANSYNRDVFAVPGRINDTFSRGCNTLIKTNKANVLTHPEDVIKMLNWDIQEVPKKPPIQKQLFVELNEDEQKICNFLSENGTNLLDQIALETQIPVFKLSSILIGLELKGVVKPLPGKQFQMA